MGYAGELAQGDARSASSGGADSSGTVRKGEPAEEQAANNADEPAVEP